MKIVYTRPDGGVNVVHPASKSEIESRHGAMSDSEFEAFIISRAVPEDGSNVRVISDSDIPSSREYRDAWVDESSESYIDISCGKAKDIALSELRARRDAELVKTDAEYVASLSKGEDVSSIVSRKDALRAATDDLKAISAEGKINDSSILESISAEKNKEL